MQATFGDLGFQSLEVERGKTTINNMDLLDSWKWHLCRHARYLYGFGRHLGASPVTQSYQASRGE